MCSSCWFYSKGQGETALSFKWLKVLTGSKWKVLEVGFKPSFPVEGKNEALEIIRCCLRLSATS